MLNRELQIKKIKEAHKKMRAKYSKLSRNSQKYINPNYSSQIKKSTKSTTNAPLTPDCLSFIHSSFRNHLDFLNEMDLVIKD